MRRHLERSDRSDPDMTWAMTVIYITRERNTTGMPSNGRKIQSRTDKDGSQENSL